MKFSLSSLLVLLACLVIAHGDPVHRFKRQLFTGRSEASSVAGSVASSSSSAGSTGPGTGSFSFPWFGPGPAPAIQFPAFPSAEKLRQSAQDAFAAIQQQAKTMFDQTAGRIQSGAASCSSPEIKSEIVEVNGRKFNQTTTTCLSNGPGSAAASVSTSSVPLDGKN